jgi:hypothetical protein
MAQDIFQKLGPEQLLGALGILGGVLVVTVYLIASNWRRVRQYQLDTALKQDMLDRGMSVADIERVLGPKGFKIVDESKVTSYPTASDVVVEWEEEWYPAILQKTDGDKYYVHYKGYDEGEWVTLDRIRFPAQPQPATTPETNSVPV